VCYSRTWNCFQSVACYGRPNIDIHLTFMQSREVPYSGGILRSYFNTNNAEQSRQGPGRDAIHGSARKGGLIAIFAIDLVLGSHVFFYHFFIHALIYCRWRPSYQEGIVGIPLTRFIPPHCCFCPNPGPVFSTSYVVVVFEFSEIS
jgi:hypothetical protein